MTANALIRRYKFSVLRPVQLFVFGAIYALAVLVVCLINGTIYLCPGTYSFDGAVFSSLYFQFAAIEFLMLVVWAAANSGSALPSEITGKTIDFFRLLPLTPVDKLVGIVIGKNLLVFGLVALNTLLVVGCGSIGQVSLRLQVQIGVLIVSLAFLSNAVSVLASTQYRPRNKRISRGAGSVLALIFVVPYMVAGVAALQRQAASGSLEALRVPFFHLSLPLLPLVSCIALYFGGWAAVGALRRFRREREPVFTFVGAVLFAVGLEALVLGFFWPHLPQQGHGLDAYVQGVAFLGISFLPILVVPPGALRQWGWYEEYLASRQKKAQALALQSNLSLAAVLYVVWMFFALVGARRAPLPDGLVGQVAVVGFCFVAFLAFLAEAWVVLSRGKRKIGVLFGTIFVIYLFLPLVLSLLAGGSSIHTFSPPGFFGTLLFKDKIDSIAFGLVAFVNAAFAILPAVGVFAGYAELVTRRASG